MRRSATLLILAVCGCGRASDHAAQSPPSIREAVTPPQSKVAGKLAQAKPAMLAVPEDKQQLRHLLALGYTVHEGHLHPPGAKECPFNMGGSVVQ